MGIGPPVGPAFLWGMSAAIARNRCFVRHRAEWADDDAAWLSQPTFFAVVDRVCFLRP